MYEIHLVTYTETREEEQEKKGFNKPILRTNYLIEFDLKFLKKRLNSEVNGISGSYT